MKANTGEIKRVRKTFTVMSYEKEEQFLTEMAAKGWRFVDTNGWVYTFERCEPEQVVYRLDYSGLALNERSDYYAMFRDYGWEYLQDINGFSYFRKPAEGAAPEDLEIFSDGDSLQTDSFFFIEPDRILVKIGKSLCGISANCCQSFF